MTSPSSKDEKEKKPDAEQEMLMREVDEAVRQDEVSTFARKYGWPLGIVFVVAIAGYGGFLLWQNQTESALQERSEELVMAMDELDAENLGIADIELNELSQGDDGAAAAAAMLRANIAMEQGRTVDAVALYDQVANNAELPSEYRDVAAIRSISAQFDELDPQAVIDRIGPLAQPDSPYFGSAGELVAHAYLAQERPEQAGPLLVSIAQNDNVPQSIRGRSRQLAGALGFDAIDDVDAALTEITGQEPADAPADANVELVE